MLNGSPIVVGARNLDERIISVAENLALHDALRYAKVKNCKKVSIKGMPPFLCFFVSSLLLLVSITGTPTQPHNEIPNALPNHKNQVHVQQHPFTNTRPY